MNIQYNNQTVASYLLLGTLFILIGLSESFFFFLVGAVAVYVALHENKKLTETMEKEPLKWS